MKRSFLLKKKKLLEVDDKEAIVLEQKSAGAILKDKKLDFPKPYYEENNISQFAAEIEDEKQKIIELASEYFADDLHVAENII